MYVFSSRRCSPPLVHLLSTEPLVQVTCNFVCGQSPAWPRNEKVLVMLPFLIFHDLVNTSHLTLVRMIRDFDLWYYICALEILPIYFIMTPQFLKIAAQRTCRHDVIWLILWIAFKFDDLVNFWENPVKHLEKIIDMSGVGPFILRFLIIVVMLKNFFLAGALWNESIY